MTKKSLALISVVFLMLVSSLLALVGFSLLTQGTESGLGFSNALQAQAIAIGGKEWYLEKLENDINWTDEVNQANIPLGSGTFDITINSSSQNRVSFTVTGKITGPANQIIQRKISLSVRKLPKAFNFAVYWGQDTGSALQLTNATAVGGNLWSRGTTQVQSGSSVSSVAYCPDTQDINGAGTFTKQKINPPYPAMPQIDETYYNDLMNTFDSYIDTYATGTDINQTTNLVLNGNIIGCANFKTDRNVTISGYGYIIAGNDINLHSDKKASGNLTIMPSGGDIYFLAGDSINVNTSFKVGNVAIYSGTYLYSRASRSTDDLVVIQSHRTTTTQLNGAFIISRRRTIIQSGVQLSNCTLYVSNVSDINNFLHIRDSRTSVSGNIISVSDSSPGLIINNGAQVTGLVYHWGGSTGDTYLDQAIIEGAVVASQFFSNRINSCTINYNPDSLPVSLPVGFAQEVLIEPASWDDN